MKPMSKTRVNEFVSYLKMRIDNHNRRMSGALARHRVLIKTERAEAEVILEEFIKIVDGKG